MILEFTVNKSCVEVYDYLTDMRKFVAVHPVIFRMDKISDNEYRVFEKLKFGFIPVTFKYKAIVKGDSATNKVVMSAVVMKMINISMNFSLNQNSHGTHVIEDVVFRSFLPVHFMMKAIFREQHKLLFSNISKASS